MSDPKSKSKKLEIEAVEVEEEILFEEEIPTVVERDPLSIVGDDMECTAPDLKRKKQCSPENGSSAPISELSETLRYGTEVSDNENVFKVMSEIKKKD
ncbi:hypothetical protein KPH14_012637 [Odynerus spinipes]|uniref:Uncharacterized protein n=1 Tax=Odynerus spinipes TaxID=1348599 RepID=A0AAD9VLV4_9HYME|nr:hypothetical protein KPH14_012637 [Odynerus spinipes]